MRLVQFRTRRVGRMIKASAVFKSAEGKRVVLSLGPPIGEADLPKLVALVENAAGDLEKLRNIRGM